MARRVILRNGKVYWHCDLCDEEYETKEGAKMCCNDERGY